MNKNYGIDWDREIAEQDGGEEQFGGLSQPCIASIPPGQFKKYLPQGELQNIGEEKMDCATRGPLNILEAKLNYLYTKELLEPEIKLFLEKNGYVTTRGIELSDAFNAIKSGTTRQGNSLISPLHSIYEDGVIPKKMLPQLSRFDEHYNPNRITSEMVALGKQFKQYLPVRYRQVQKIFFKEFLKESPLDIAGYAWPEPVAGVYPRTVLRPNHVFVALPESTYEIFDNYADTYDGDFFKVLAPDYDFVDYGYELYIVGQNTEKVIKGLMQQAIEFLKQLVNELSQKKTMPTQTENGKKLYRMAKTLIGTQVIKLTALTQFGKLGCMASMNEVYRRTFGFPIGGGASTADAVPFLKDQKRFEQVRWEDVLPGDIIMFATGTSGVEPNAHGHVFVAGEKWCMSNSSETGTWEATHTYGMIKSYWIDALGFPPMVFRPL